MNRVALVAAFFLGGCYTFAPAPPDQVRPDDRVRVRLAPVEAARLDDFTDGDARLLEGRLVDASADSLLLLVTSHTELRGTRVETRYQRVHVGRGGILELELRSLDRPRTYLVSGLAAVALTVFALDRLKGGGGSEVVDPGGGPNDALLPAVRIPLPLGWP